MKWISVEEMLPQLNQKVIIKVDFTREYPDKVSRNFATGSIYTELIPGKQQFWSPNKQITYDPQFWIPLPEEPIE